MSLNRQEEIKKIIESFFLSYAEDGKPIDVNFRELVPEITKPERYTHLIHSYPAKLLANIPFFFLASDILCPKDGIVLDPFCGTGTVLLEAALSGRKAYGADANPLAELITSVKTNYIPKSILLGQLNSLLDAAKKNIKSRSYPESIAIWFSRGTMDQLSALQTVIMRLDNEREKAFFELCFSCVIRKVSYADPSISVPVHWNPERFRSTPDRMDDVKRKLQQLHTVDVFEKFEAICKTNIERIDTLSDKRINEIDVRIISDDARKLKLKDNSVDFILTSPPYAGAQKYIRASWLNLYWLNRSNLDDIREIKRLNIGREDYRKDEVSECYTGIEAADIVLRDLYRSGYTKRAFIAANYLNEMKVALNELYRVLKNDAYLGIVIGNNTVCKRLFDTQDYISSYLESIGMKLQFKLIDDIKSFGLMTKRNKTADKISREWVLMFKK